MQQFRATTGPAYRRWLVPLIFLLALAVRCERAWVTPVVNPDCLRFIAMAKGLPAHPIHTLRTDTYHPLQAVVGGFFYWVGFSHLATNQRMAWITAMQAVGVLAGAMLAVELFWLARRFGAPPWAATGAAILWIVGRKTSGYGADGISDMLFLSLMVGSVLLAMQTGLRWHRWKWFVAGMIAGLSYLTRPEGVAAVLMLWGALAIYHGWPLKRWLHWRLPQRRGPICALACGVLLLLGFVLVGLPYMMAIGKFTGKKATVLNDLAATPPAMILHSLHGPSFPWAKMGGITFSGADGCVGHTNVAAMNPPNATLFGPAQRDRLAARAGMGPPAALPQVASFQPWRGHIWFKIGQELSETLGYAPGIIMILVLLAKPVLLGRQRWRGLVLAWAALWLAVMIWLLSTADYLANRHTLVLVFLLEALFALSLAQAAFLCARVRREIGLDPSASGGMCRDRRAVGFGLVVCFLGCLPGLVRLWYPPQRGLHYLRDAAAWINTHTAPNVRVAAPKVDSRRSLIAYYSNRRYFYRAYSAGAVPVKQMEQLCGSTRFIVPLIFQGHDATAFPQKFGALQVLRDQGREVYFRSRHALQGDIAVLYGMGSAEVIQHP